MKIWLLLSWVLFAVSFVLPSAADVVMRDYTGTNFVMKMDRDGKVIARLDDAELARIRDACK